MSAFLGAAFFTVSFLGAASFLAVDALGLALASTFFASFLTSVVLDTDFVVFVLEDFVAGFLTSDFFSAESDFLGSALAFALAA
ncbi:putative membrane protein, partial [Chlamydia psittaci 01DC11]